MKRLHQNLIVRVLILHAFLISPSLSFYLIVIHKYELQDKIIQMEIKQITQKMHHFVEAQGWYIEGSSRPQTLKNLAISLSLEASEILELFQWTDTIQQNEDLADELADVALYLFQIASIAEIDLEEAILDKLNKNYQRKWG
jgi:NTP pyrophosphatase (non-canonical NTP hydrolase)